MGVKITQTREGNSRKKREIFSVDKKGSTTDVSLLVHTLTNLLGSIMGVKCTRERLFIYLVKN